MKQSTTWVHSSMLQCCRLRSASHPRALAVASFLPEEADSGDMSTVHHCAQIESGSHFTFHCLDKTTEPRGAGRDYEVHISGSQLLFSYKYSYIFKKYSDSRDNLEEAARILFLILKC